VINAISEVRVMFHPMVGYKLPFLTLKHRNFSDMNFVVMHALPHGQKPETSTTKISLKKRE